MDLSQFESRKQSHLQHALDPRSQTRESSGLDRVKLLHCALPEMDLADVDLSTPFRKTRLSTPLFIAGMTAGHADAPALNRIFANAAASRGWIFGVGSQRRELVDSAVEVDRWSQLREEAGPGLLLVGNLGLSQVAALPVSRLKKLVSSSRADALAVHLNALQEALQPEGTPQFSGGLSALKKLAPLLGRPLILKETGCGFSPRVLKMIRLLPLAAVDVSGTGGTHWGRIEGFRAESSGNSLQARAARSFSDWGISTVDSVRAARKILSPRTEIWASGGVRSGLDAARLIAIGATRVGFAKPALEAALQGEKALNAWMETVEFELRVALFSSGYRTPAELRKHAEKNGDVIHV